MKFFVMMVGIPGSGKSTTIKASFPNSLIISPDNFIPYTKEEPWSFSRVKRAWKQSDKLLKDSLKEDVIIFDATNIQAKRRKKYINIAKRADFVPVALVCKTPFVICCERNNVRDEFRRVSYQVLERMFNNFQQPRLEEGFDAVVTIDTINYSKSNIISSFDDSFFSDIIKNSKEINNVKNC